MPKFKIGDRVKLVGINGYYGIWETTSRSKTGVIQDYSKVPWVLFDDGDEDCGSEEYLELVEEEKPMTKETKFKAGDVVVNVSDYDTYLTVGKEYTLTHVSSGGSLYFLGDNGNERFRPSRHYKLKEAHITEAEKRGAKFGTMGVVKRCGTEVCFIKELPTESEKEVYWHVIDKSAVTYEFPSFQIRLDHEPGFIAWSDAPEDLKYDADRVYYRDEPVKWIAKPEGTNLDFEWVAIVDNNGGPAFIVSRHLKVKV